jgi:hypothetical protein
LSPTGQPGFSTLLSFLNRTSISTSMAVASTKNKHREPVLRIRMFLGLLDPDPDPLVRGGTDPDPFIIRQNEEEKP